MAVAINTVLLGGHLTRDPQVKFLAPVAPAAKLYFHVTMSPPRTGHARAQFSVAVEGTPVVAGRLVCATDRADA